MTQEFAYHGEVTGGAERFKILAIFVLRVRDGLIVESRDYFGGRQRLD
jgi:ketosteroid isomerase-like protein